MENEDYGQLKQIINSFLEDAAKMNEFDFGDFSKQMEQAFTRLDFRNESTSAIKNILLIRLDAAGDFIVTTPSIRAIRENYPSAYITLIVSQRAYPIAALCPYVNEVLQLHSNTLDGFKLLKTISHCLRFSEEHLWKNHYDLCFYFSGMGPEGPYFRSFLPFISGARERVGYQFEDLDKYLHNFPVPFRPRAIVHECLRALNLVQAYGLNIRSTHTEVWFNKADLYQAHKILDGFGEGRVKIAVCVGASVPARLYPVEKYFAALKEIVFKGASVVIVGGPSDLEAARFLEFNLPKRYVKNTIAFNPTWRVSAALISQTDMYIGNDTGPKHIAAALKKPVISLSRVAKDLGHLVTNGVTEAAMFYPWQTETILLQPNHQIGECAKANSIVGCVADGPHCIAQIEPAEIVDAYEKIVAPIKSRRG